MYVRWMLVYLTYKIVGVLIVLVSEPSYPFSSVNSKGSSDMQPCCVQDPKYTVPYFMPEIHNV